MMNTIIKDHRYFMKFKCCAFCGGYETNLPIAAVKHWRYL